MNELDQLLKEMADAPAPSIEQIKTRCDIDEEDLEVSLMTASVKQLEKAGDLLRLIRESGGVGTRELARRLNVEGSTVSRMEGNENIEIRTLSKYLEQLDGVEVELIVKKDHKEIARIGL